MIVKNAEWKNFKDFIVQSFDLFINEFDELIIPLDNDNFQIILNGVNINPVFFKKEDYLKVEYDFTNCATKIRKLSFSKFKNNCKLEFSLKK
jgi:hypothetical protein